MEEIRLDLRILNSQPSVTIRAIKENEAEIAAKFIDEAREYQQSQGFVQWTEEYPNISTVKEDIKTEKGFMLLEKDTPFGYLCIDFDGEPAYQNIEGKWKTDQKYAVVHRLALSKNIRGKGLSKKIFPVIKEFCESKNIFSIRVDTDPNNKIMQHILNREGYEYCGLVNFQGSPKLAYELDFHKIVE